MLIQESFAQTNSNHMQHGVSEINLMAGNRDNVDQIEDGGDLVNLQGVQTA